MNEENKIFKVVGIGEILWDMLPGGKQFGGAPANFAFHARSLGADSYVVSAVGTDPLGRELLTVLSKLGLNQDYVFLNSDFPTGTVSVKLDAIGKPDYIIHENVAWDSIPLSPDLIKLAGAADAVCFGTLAQRSDISHQTIVSFIKNCRSDCLRVFDINLRQHFYKKKCISELLALTDILKLNDEELKIVSQLFNITGSETEILNRLIKNYALKLVALTRGEEGSRLKSEFTDSELDAIKVKIVDSVGAGDAFTAAMVVGLLKRLPLERIHKNANDLASFVCTRQGATPILPIEILSKYLLS